MSLASFPLRAVLAGLALAAFAGCGDNARLPVATGTRLPPVLPPPDDVGRVVWRVTVR